MKKNAILIGLGLLIVLLFVGNAAQVWQLGFVDRVSAIFYDYRLRLTMPNTVDERIVILDIDEKSLKEDGRWPWGRDRLGGLMDKLFDGYGVAIVGFDVVFAEKDESSGLQVLERIGQNQLKGDAAFQSTLAQLRPQLEYDNLFADRMRGRKTVLGYYLTEQKQQNVSGQLPPPVFPPGFFKGRPIVFTSWNGYGANLPELQQAAAGAGHFNPIVDRDGAVRRVPMLAEYGGAYYESLSLAMARVLLGSPPLRAGFAEDADANYGGLEWLEMDTPAGGVLKVPVDANVAALVPYRGERGSFRYISISDVLHDRVPADQLRNKVVLVGTSAPGLLDMRATPVGEVYPGVEINANMLAGLLDQDLKERPPYMMGAEVVWLLLIGISLSFMMPALSPVKAMLASALMFGTTVGLSLAAWHYGDVVMPVANSLMMIVLIFALDMSYGYFFESRTKRQIAGLFGKYVPTELVEEMVKHPEQVVSMKGDSREMSILFSDVVGFTSISEKLAPKELSLLMNEFLTPLSRVVSKHQGKVDKYMGDCIMAFWGAPLPDSVHARHAIMAALEMQATLKSLQEGFKARGWPEIRIGVGVNTGRVSVGNMGSEVRVAYTVMGDAVNLASRLEGLTRQYGVDIIVGEATRDAVPDFVYRELDHVRVKGKDEPVGIYEPIGLAGAVSAQMLEEIRLFDDVLRSYRSQDWGATERQLQELLQRAPDSRLYRIYAERVAYFREHPPAADWDGVFVFHTK